MYVFVFNLLVNESLITWIDSTKRFNAYHIKTNASLNFHYSSSTFLLEHFSVNENPNSYAIQFLQCLSSENLLSGNTMQRFILDSKFVKAEFFCFVFFSRSVFPIFYVAVNANTFSRLTLKAPTTKLK